MTISAAQPDWPLTEQPSLVLSWLSHLGLIEVTGEQGRSFVHGQVTTDITALEASQWRWGAHCDAKGKMIASFRTFAIGEKLMMLMPQSTIEVDLPQLKKYAVFSQAELENVSETIALIGVSGSDAEAFINSNFGDVAGEVSHFDDVTILKDNDRFILVVPQSQVSALIAKAPVELTDKSHWQRLEITSGYPNISAEHANQYVPQMCNLQAINGISFNKGCYMGQETIARMKYRGGNKRALYILTGTASNSVNSETQIEVQIDGDYRRAGKVIESVQYNDQVVLTAVLANDTSNDAVLRIRDDANSELSVMALPYSLDDE